MIKGIGAKTAKRIVERFGEATFYVIEEKPDLLTEIKGISYDKAQKISEVFCEQHGAAQSDDVFAGVRYFACIRHEDL